MRRSVPLLIFAGLVVLAACANTPDQGAANSTGPAQGPQLAPAAVPNSFCSPITASDLVTEINNLFIKNAWPDPSSAQGKFSNVQNLLQAGNVGGAQSTTRDLVGFITNKFQHLSASQQAATLADYTKLVSDLYCYVGISGTVYDLNPGDPEKAFDIPGVGGVDFPANSVPVGTLVSLTNLGGGPCPLLTSLDCYRGFLDISLYPSAVLPQAATVVLCPPAGISTTIAVGHQDATSGFEILTPAVVPPLLGGTCSTSASLNDAPRTWLARMLDRAVEALLPKPLEASVFRTFPGVGGTVLKFSPFGIVDLTLTATGGVGGSLTKFAPQASPNSAPPAGAPPLNPPLPATVFQGPVGTSTTTGLPSVTIATPGGDADGSNKVAGVTVTFSIGASVNYDPDSQASVCQVSGGIAVAQATVQVVTDANGVATLPCLIYGNVAGFANLSASFDPSTLGFPNSHLVTINGSSSSSLNWLVQSVAGLPSKLKFITSPSGSAQAGVALAQQPTLQLLDAFDNEVYTAGVAVTASVTSGGGTAGGTTSVNTDAAGVATFTTLSIGGKVAGVDQTLSFGFTGITTAPTAVVQLSAGPASQLEITTQPSSTAAAGVAFAAQPGVTIEDQFGNTVNSTAAVAGGLASGNPALAGTTSVNAVGGVASFTNLRIDGVAGNRTLSFTSGALTSAASNTIAVGAGPTSQIAITSQPSSTAQAGLAFGAQPVATIQDQFGNTVLSSAAVTASIATGAGTLAGALSVNAVAGVATFGTLRIDGLVGNRTLQFASGLLVSPPSTTVAVSAGTASVIQTYMGGTAAATFTYSGALSANTAVSPAPQVIVKDAFGNPVGSQPVFWNATTSNGGVLTVGATGTPTNASGTALVSSWVIGDGLNEATAGLTSTSSSADALFSASTPTGVSGFACAAGTGTSKTDVMPFSIKTPNASVRTVTLYMSVTGQASTISSYPATLTVYKGTGGAQIGSGTGIIQVPGDNGKALPVTFVLSDPATQAESNGSSVLLFKLAVTAPGTRKPQLWYSSATYKTNDPCYNSLIYTSYPTLTTFKRGLSINVTN